MPHLPSWSDLRKRATPSFVFIAPLVLLVLLALYIRTTRPPELVFLEVDLPRTVSPVEDGSMVLDATFRIHNRSDEVAELNVAGECRVLRWFIVDAEEQIVQSAPRPDCAEDSVIEIVDAKSALVYSTAIELDESRYIAGAKYYLQTRFWGHEAYQDFRVGN